MLVVAGHAPGHLLPLVWLRLVWSCLLRAAGYLVGKAPRRAGDELLALATFAAHPERIRDFRRRLRSTPRAAGTAAVVRSLRPPRWASLRIGAEAVSHAVSDRYHSVAGDAEVALLDELTADDLNAVVDDQPSNPWLSPIVLAGVLTILASVVAAPAPEELAS